MARKINDLLKAAADREGSGVYDRKDGGYLGAFQMSEITLLDIGAKDRQGNWTGKFGHSEEEFRKSKEIQNKAMIENMKKNWQYIKNVAKDKIGKEINGIIMTPSAMLMGAHLLGSGGMLAYLKTDGKNYPIFQADGNDTHIEEYLTKFSDYDVSNITGLEHKAYAWSNYADKHIKIPKEIAKVSKMSKNKFSEKQVEELNKINKNWIEKIKKEKEKFYEKLESEGKNRTKEYKKWLEKNPKAKIEKKQKSSFEVYENNGINFKGKPTGFASPVSSPKTKTNFKVDFNHVSIDGKKYKDWSKKEKEAFWEGFSSNSFTNSKSYKSNIKIDNKTNNSKPRKMDLDNSYTGEGHWVTLDNGNHVFIED